MEQTILIHSDSHLLLQIDKSLVFLFQKVSSEYVQSIYLYLILLSSRFNEYLTPLM